MPKAFAIFQNILHLALLLVHFSTATAVLQIKINQSKNK